MNLLSKLHKNSILTGPIESYCLVCGCLLYSEEESYAHIHEPSHVDKLDTVQQLTDYNDCIIKCKEGYFCRYCNLLLPTIKRVSLHISESTHNENKNSQSITRHEGVILAFDRVAIADGSWHGLDGSTCSVCNEDYDDEEVHKGGATHVLNLIQVKCEFGHTFIYRKVDEVLFFCLTCNEILPILEKPTHHETEKHVNLYEKCKTEGTDSLTRKVSEKVAIEPNNNYVTLPPNEATKGEPKEVVNKESNKLETVKENKNTTKSIKTEKVQISEPKSGFQNKKSNKDLDNKAKKNTYPLDKEHSEPKKTIETDKAVVKTPVNNEQNNAAKVQSDKAGSYVYSYLKANNFIMKALDRKVYCTICDCKFNENQSALHSFDDHHIILYAKHVARWKSELAEKTLNEPDNKTNQMNGGVKPDLKSSHVNKENMPIKQDSQKAQGQLKPVQIEEKVVGKDSKCSEDNTVKQKQTAEVVPPNETESFKESIDVGKPVKEQATNKVEHQALENQEKLECIANKQKVPNDKYDKVQISANERNKEETKPEPVKPTAQNKKAVKKAQKKAAKAKISKTQETVLPKAIHEAEATIPEIPVPVTNETATKERTGDTETTQDVLSYKQTESSETQKGVNPPEVGMARFASDTELKTDKLMNILKTISQVNSTPKDVIINGKYVVGNLSFVLVVCDGNKAECVACEEGLAMDDVYKHINTEQHKSNVEECLVVTSLDDEFVRQVKTEEYHCGYCNMLLQNWESMSTHLDTYRHDDAKTSASWRLVRYQPYFKNCETKEVRSILTSIFRSTECVCLKV